MKTFLNIFVITAMMISSSFVNAQDETKFPVSCSIKGPKYGTDSAESVKHLSLYRENYKHWRANNRSKETIKYVMPSWRYVFLNAPLASQNTYLDGMQLYSNLIENATDKELKESYIDTLLMIYDRNIEAYGCARMYGEGYLLGRKGYDIFQYRPADKLDAYYYFKKSIEIEGDNSEPAILSFFYKVTDELVRAGKLDTLLIYDNYDLAMAPAENQLAGLRSELAENPADSVRINKKINSYSIAESNINSLFDPWATCEQIIKINNDKFENNKTNIKWLTNLTQLMERKNCTSDPLYFKAAEEAYKLSPTPEGAFVLGKSYVKAGQYANAIRLLNDAVNGINEPLKKADAYLVLAEAYRNAGQYANAKSAALRSAELDPTDGMPYIVIGDLYLNTAGSCGDNPVTKRAGAWAAADKYAKAKAVSSNPDVINLASQRYNSAYASFPKNEDLFFYNLTKGSSYTVSCWYTESTIIRSVD